MNGNAVGQLHGTHVHRLSGQYIGELHESMILNKHMGNFGNIGNPGNPGNPGRPGNPGNRGARNYGFPDVSMHLFDQ
ncbi:4-fold beta flower protein [Erwinia sp. E_sp_B01_9]|uniref:4-fold beta flower protein n=1 Tax=unclassified Erwinia TaxID=2622719 RepID=UPI003D9AD784